MNEKERQMFDAVRRCLTPDLIPANFRGRPDNPMFGHCYHATKALFDLLGGRSAGYVAQRAIDDQGVSHYWLRSPSGEDIDPTADQYVSIGKIPPHDRGKGTGLRASKASLTIVSMIGSSIE